MRIGNMNRRLAILRRVQTGTDALNSPIFEWQTLRTVWAEKIHKKEDERFAPDQHQRYAVRRVTFRIYHQTDVSEVDRVECEGVTYDIKGLRELGFREGTEITAESQS
ncbi:MAG: head-tail adaptor protein [Mesorhizobium sp.]|uniref:phage head closure protein n=1 Tax=Mesorhizobium sp. TaxID=1871066 RepID=UPI001202FBBD|nr:phage head closure protein [Mesorhizobium sp.]TIO52987.1 MAG: head-tail adaptor protein [Mesorhizobium sp.]TIO61820.1 MAG: head-tail adaptor protein [Mesorhizobium sp.]TJV66725.1 MAG: head-tail adaptor protein [Mesorhizobium sp.]